MKLQLPWINRAAGTTAGIVFQTYNGNTYSHAKTAYYHYPNTQAQQETQGKFYNIMWQFLYIYRSMRIYIPAQVRHNCNMYNVLSSGVFAASLTYPNPQRKTPPVWFGADKMQQVKVNFANGAIEVSLQSVSVKFNVSLQFYRRNFNPKFYHLLLVNASQQLLMSETSTYTSSCFAIELQNISKWLPTDTISVYLMLSNKNFSTNFYKIPL